MAGVSKERQSGGYWSLEKHGLKVKRIQGRQSIIVFNMDNKPELLVRPTSQEVAASVRQNDNYQWQNVISTSDKMSWGNWQNVTRVRFLLDKTLDKIL